VEQASDLSAAASAALLSDQIQLLHFRRDACATSKKTALESSNAVLQHSL